MVVKEHFKLPCRRITRQEQVSNKVRFVTKPTASHLLMAKAFFIVIVIFLTVSPVAAQDTLTVSLQSAMEQSLEISPEIRAKEAKVDFASARQRLAKTSRFLPISALPVLTLQRRESTTQMTHLGINCI